MDDFQDIMSDVPSFTITKNEIANGINIIELLAEKTKIFSSKGEAKKMIQAGGLSVNMEKVLNTDTQINELHLLPNDYLLIRKGKKDFIKLNVLS
jgi:tyrosyl-tRNA synthetase